jgi:hypothetical protein
MWDGPVRWPKTLPPFESGKGTGKKRSTFAKSKRWNKDLCLLFFLYRSPAKEEITSSFPSQLELGAHKSSSPTFL